MTLTAVVFCNFMSRLCLSAENGSISFYKNTTLSKTGDSPIDFLKTEGVTVVYQGVEGAYSHGAVQTFFGSQVSSFHVDTWRHAMEAIQKGDAHYAVLPIENSTAGIVQDNYDLLAAYNHVIVGEQLIPCKHVLMGLPGTDLSQIQHVYSHPQALMQCADFLESHNQWNIHEYANTAMAAQKIAEEKDPAQAAIASPYAARQFGLEILAEKIYSNPGTLPVLSLCPKTKFTAKMQKKSA